MESGQPSISPIVHSIFEPVTCTWQYIVADPSTSKAVVIDSVLDFDPIKRQISTGSADALLSLIQDKGYSITRILETHAHADHLTASQYLQKNLEQKQDTRPAVCIGKRIALVQTVFAEIYGIPKVEYEDVFDHTFDDDEAFEIGEMRASVIYLPGHTPDHVGYVIGSNVFCGDSIFNADVGSARCDFPGGSATSLYASARKLLGLPDHYTIWVGHDYPPGDGNTADGKDVRGTPCPSQTVAEQRSRNKHLMDGTSEEAFVGWREQRDAVLGEPKLMPYSLQVNVRGGRLPRPDAKGNRFFMMPIVAKETL